MLLSLLAVLACLATASLLACTEIEDADFGHHVAVGRLLLHDFGAVRRYAYSYWLYQVATAIVFDHLGPAAIVLLRALFILATFILAYLLARRIGAPGWAGALGLALGLLTSHERFIDRPELFSFLAWVLVLWILLLHRHDRFVWLLVPLQILWVNSHLWFGLLPALFVAFAIGDRLDLRGHLAPGHLRRTAALLGAILVATCIGPAGPTAWLSQLYLVQFLGRNYSLPFRIGEMMSPFSTFETSLAVWIFRIAMPVSVLLALATARRLGWGAVFALLFASLLAARARRAMPLFGVTAAVLLPVALAALGERLPRAARKILPRAAAAVALAIGIVGIHAVASGRLFLTLDHDKRIALRISPRFPGFKAARFLRDEQIQGPLFHTTHAAGAIVFMNGTRLTPFLDARWVGTPETIAAFQRLRGASDQTVASIWQDFDREHGYQVALLDSYQMPALLRYLSNDNPGWATVHVDATSSVLVKRGGKNESAIVEHEAKLRTALAGPDRRREERLGDAVVRFLRSRKPAPLEPLRFPYDAMLRANYALQLGRAYDGQAAYLDLLEREKGSLHVSTHRLEILNNILWCLKDSDQAAAMDALSEALTRDPGTSTERRRALQVIRALALGRLGQSAKAEEIARGIIADPAATKDDRWQSWCTIASARSGAGDYEAAADAYSRATQERPDLAETFRSLGLILDQNLLRTDEALKAYEAFLSLGGRDARIDERIHVLRRQTMQRR